jgi:hypothetical protein
MTRELAKISALAIIGMVAVVLIGRALESTLPQTPISCAHVDALRSWVPCR